jgi:TonB-linked SusC/RagA family outer membrane protein
MENRCNLSVTLFKSIRFPRAGTARKSIVFMLLFLVSQLAGIVAYAALPQQGTVTGKVTDRLGDAMVGVTITVKGTTQGVTSDINGIYTITGVPSNATLVYRFVGMGTKEVLYTGQPRIDVTLEESSIGMDEVVVVGYATQTKKTLSGAISSVSSADIVRTPAAQLSEALVGKMAGITSRATDARPGRGVNLQIRNMGTPLFVIDGVPYGGPTGMTSFGLPQGSGQDVFNSLAIEDVESITILKDASAALYGFRAANGVILVTTKTGKRSDMPKINVNGYYGMQNFTRFYQPANAGQHVRGLVESEQNLGRDPSLLYTAAELAKWEAGTEPGYKSYDYKDMVVRKNVPQSYINVNASGGSEKSSYYFSISHLDQQSMIRDFSFGRTNMQVNLDASLAKGLKIGTQISTRLEKSHNVGVPGLDDYFNPFLSILTMWPTESPYANDNPAYIHQTHNVNVNPATYKDDITGWLDMYWRSANVNMFAEYDFDNGLKATGSYSYNYANEDFDGFEYTWNAYKYNSVTDTYYTEPGWGNQNPWREKHKRNVVSRFAKFQLNYIKSFGDHNIMAIAAYERSDYDNQYFVVHTVPSNNYVSQMSFSEQDYLADQWNFEARAGYIGRFNYNYKQKYLVELIARYDGSYLYAPDKRWGLFPAASIGWRISDESFFTSTLGNYIDMLKIRASYGQTGSESGVSAFGYLGGYTYGSGSSVLDGNYVIGLVPRGLPVRNLSWVTNTNANFGIDFGILENKITGQFDVFQRTRTGLPASRYDVLLPSEVGYSLPNENLNSDAHRGIEGMIVYASNVGSVNYTIGINGTLARQRALESYKPRFGNSWDEYRNSAENRWSSITWGYDVMGRFQTQEEINAYPVNIDNQGNKTLLPGDFIFRDVNGDGVINAMDQRPIGYSQGATPYMSFGMVNTVNWKGFNLNLDFQGATMMSYNRNWELRFPFQNNGTSPWFMLADRWRREDPYDPTSKWIPGTYPAIRKDNTAHRNYLSTNNFWMININYFRLKNIELGYSLPRSMVSKLGASNIRVYVKATNLFSIDNVKHLEIDPEISSGSGLVYPQAKLMNFGFNLNF